MQRHCHVPRDLGIANTEITTGENESTAVVYVLYICCIHTAPYFVQYIPCIFDLRSEVIILSFDATSSSNVYLLFQLSRP